MSRWPKYIGLDLAKPGSDRTVMSIHGGRQAGKNAALDREVEKALDNGIDVYDGRTGELRGAGTTKDVTPQKPKQIKTDRSDTLCN